MPRVCASSTFLITRSIAAISLVSCSGFVPNECGWPTRTTISRYPPSTTSLGVSELHIPGYRESKKQFILTEEDVVGEAPLHEISFTDADYSSTIPYKEGNLLHKTNGFIFTEDECQMMIDEAEAVADALGWTTKRHGNYPTTDLPIAELPNTLKFLRRAVEERIYPLLREQFKTYLPDGRKLRVADGFVVKYDAEGGQSELKPHRDGSVLSFNIALNPSNEFEGGGTWFESLGESVKIEQGEVCSHASGIMHGGHGITRGKRYIMVCFVIMEGYDTWSMRFYNDIRDL